MSMPPCPSRRLAEGPVELAVEGDGADYRFTAGTESATVTVGAGSARTLDADWIPGFTSVRFGVRHWLRRRLTAEREKGWVCRR